MGSGTALRPSAWSGDNDDDFLWFERKNYGNSTVSLRDARISRTIHSLPASKHKNMDGIKLVRHRWAGHIARMNGNDYVEMLMVGAAVRDQDGQNSVRDERCSEFGQGERQHNTEQAGGGPFRRT